MFKATKAAILNKTQPTQYGSPPPPPTPTDSPPNQTQTEESSVLYTHRLRIDYGKLDSPIRQHRSRGKENSIIECLNQEEEELIQTKRKHESTAKGRYMQAHSTGKKKRVARITLDTSAINSSNPVQTPARVKGSRTAKTTRQPPSAARSRVVTVYLPGQPVTTKLITYPDNQEYLKLCRKGQ